LDELFSCGDKSQEENGQAATANRMKSAKQINRSTSGGSLCNCSFIICCGFSFPAFCSSAEAKVFEDGSQQRRKYNGSSRPPQQHSAPFRDQMKREFQPELTGDVSQLLVEAQESDFGRIASLVQVVNLGLEALEQGGHLSLHVLLIKSNKRNVKKRF
jgi:hypothetical protein